MSVRLPLFPLNTVLFPHMPAGLHIFEQRYRDMLHDCQEQGTSFGIVGIREGVEVGQAAFPFSVGTLAQIHEVETLDDGRYNLVIAGASRFRIESLSLSRSYLVGDVHYLQDCRGDEAAVPGLRRQVERAFRSYRATLLRLKGETETEDEELPDDVELLSYLVAASLDVEVNRRQALLEEDSVSGRLRSCLRELRRESVFLDQMLTRRAPALVPVSLN